nr:Chain D, Engineered FMRP-1b peptide [Homo sapiens]
GGSYLKEVDQLRALERLQID